MKKLFALTFCCLILTACSSDNFSNATKEATEAVENLANEAIEIKASTEVIISRIQKAIESSTKAIEAVNTATEDIKAIKEESEDE